MRPDGRANNELRRARFILDYVVYPEGSVLIEMGETRVLCNVTVDDRLPFWRQNSGAGWTTEVGDSVALDGLPVIDTPLCGDQRDERQWYAHRTGSHR